MQKSNKQTKHLLKQNSFHAWMQLPNRFKRIRWKQCLVNGRALLVHCSPFNVPLQVVGSASLCLAWLVLKRKQERVYRQTPSLRFNSIQLLYQMWHSRMKNCNTRVCVCVWGCVSWSRWVHTTTTGSAQGHRIDVNDRWRCDCTNRIISYFTGP